jgi:hypothetical protein
MTNMHTKRDCFLLAASVVIGTLVYLVFLR